MNLISYLKRIHCEHVKEPTLENLKILHQNHVKHVTFENLDMHIGKKVEMSLEKAFDKVINRNRGGFCCELNYLFSWLLQQLGYEITLHSCRVYLGTSNSYNSWFSHLTTLIKIRDKMYLADVGFSYPYKCPLEFVVDKIQKDMIGFMKFRIDEANKCFTLLRCNTALNEENLKDETFWTPCYQLNPVPRKIEEFLNMLEWVQSENNVRFYNRTICIRQIDNGIIMLLGYKFSTLLFENSILIKRNDVELTREQVYKFGVAQQNISSNDEDRNVKEESSDQGTGQEADLDNRNKGNMQYNVTASRSGEFV
ncbi:unnamed protein product [Brachionus calyciflorus]|uniref:arylamine N-acetyltransferase n=1 Tax=Brachionus calyciflorus TaxID=104777 RepID=A0A813P5B8_9BILA|nr:unnamed protein product [Brachionus calyciflorus]